MCSAPPCRLHGGAETEEQVPLDNVVSGSGTGTPCAGGERPAAPLLFRGLPIAWAVSQETRCEMEKNAFGADEIEEHPGRKLNLIWYGGKPYQKEAFYRVIF